MDLFLRKNHLLRCWGWISFPNWIGAHTLSLLLKLPKKIRALIRSMKFLSPEVVMYLYKSTIWPRMEYCLVWAGAPSCYLWLLDKLQKLICRIVGPSLAVSFELWTHCWNVASGFILSNRYYSGRCSSEFAQLVPLPYSQEIFLSLFLEVTRMSMSTVSFLAWLDSRIFCL